ncbi:MAG: flagellar hook capping FlgD N-terminal domain-containing protein [Terracidiphilus sp.]
MAALASGIFSHSMTAAQALSGSSANPLASPAAGAGDSGSTSSTDSSTISANDFLTLLVTEMQNQDPTADTDPNEYINQLVNVNSLEQLISINQNLSTALGDSGTTPGSSASTPSAMAASDLTGSNAIATSAHPSIAAPSGGVLATAQTVSSGGEALGDLSALSGAVKRAPGNLTAPNALPAAQTVAHALDGRSRTHSKASE